MPVVLWAAVADVPTVDAAPVAPTAEREQVETVGSQPGLRATRPPALSEGRRLLDAGAVEEAVVVLRRAASATGGAEVHKYLARALRRLRRFEEAEGEDGRYREARRPLAP